MSGNTNIVGASPFGVSAGDVTDLQTSIDLYRTASQNPRQALITKSQAKKQAGEMLRDVIDNLLVKQLDKMANTLKSSNKNFFDGYKQSREIIDLGTSSAKVRGVVLDENDAPVKGVEFVIYQTGTSTKVAETETDVKGKYGVTKLPVGDFDFKWSKDGYKAISETNVHIAAGKDLRRKIVMTTGIVREGDLMQGAVSNIEIKSIDGNKIISVTLEVTGSAMRFYAAKNPTDGNGGGMFIDVQVGQSISKTANEFASQTGIGMQGNFLNVQNIGGGQGHWKITFE